MAELLVGIAFMPAGQRRKRLADNLDALLTLRVLAFDAGAARRYPELCVIARKAGHGFPVPDGYLAAIAAAHGFAVASRDVSPFEAAGLHVIDPWSA